MPDGDLRQLAEVEEISIGFTRPDGSTGSTPLWVVQAGEAILVGSIRGRRGGWSRLGANPDGEVGDGAHTHPVTMLPRGPSVWTGAVVTARSQLSRAITPCSTANQAMTPSSTAGTGWTPTSPAARSCAMTGDPSTAGPTSPPAVWLA
jgi:hypothetical protein